MDGLIIIAIPIICVLIIVIGSKLTYRPSKTSVKFQESFWNDSDYENERKLLEILNDTTPFAHVNESLPIKAKQEQHKVCYSANHNKIKNLIGSGAEIVIACGADPLLNHGTWEELDVLTSQVIIQKRPYYATRVLTASTPLYNIIRITNEVEKVTQHRQVNVATQATLGGIIGGSTGAIIGAANAIQKNAAGGEKVTTGLIKNYGFWGGYGCGIIDTIYISKAIMDKVGTPPNHFVVSKTNDYWIIEDTRTTYGGNGLIGGYDKTGHEELLNYFQKIVEHYSASCKYNNGIFEIGKPE